MQLFLIALCRYFFPFSVGFSFWKMKIPMTSMVLDVPPAPKFKSRAKVESEHEYDQPLSGAAGMGGFVLNGFW